MVHGVMVIFFSTFLVLLNAILNFKRCASLYNQYQRKTLFIMDVSFNGEADRNWQTKRGRNGSLVVFGLAVHSVTGSILLWGNFPVEGIFPLELTWVQAQFPKNSFGWKYKLRSSLCTHAFHRTDSKDPDVHILDGWMPATKNTPSTHHPWRRNETTLMVGLKKRSRMQKSHPKMVNPRDIAGERRKRKREGRPTYLIQGR